MAHYIQHDNNKYYFIDKISNFTSYKNKDLLVEGEFIKKDFPSVTYMKETDPK